jgi:hypothetical protein
MDERIDVTAYSGYRGEERPVAFTLRGRKPELLKFWICGLKKGRRTE